MHGWMDRWMGGRRVEECLGVTAAAVACPVCFRGWGMQGLKHEGMEEMRMERFTE